MSLAVIALGLALGFIPGYTGETEGSFLSSSAGVSCGSPFIVSGDLTGSGLAACEEGGLSDRRAWALGLIAAGLVLAVTGGGSSEPDRRDDRSAERPTSD